MKSSVRLLFTFPFVFVAICYYIFNNPDEKCLGLLDVIIILGLYGLLFLTGIFALVGTLRKRQGEKLRVEPLLFSIIIATILLVAYNVTLRGHRNGDEWISAKREASNDMASIQTLTLRKNGNFTFDSNLDCSVSGEYQKIGDTIIFSKKMIDRISDEMATKYLLKSSRLIPLFDTTHKITFTITEIN